MSYPFPISRRSLLAAASAGITPPILRAATPASGLKVSIFSKHLRFLEGPALVSGAASLGFDGIDLAVRKNGHIEPDRVTQELPVLVREIHQHGLIIPMITTDIADTSSPYAEDILRTMHEQGIRYYRWGGFKYNYSLPLAAQLEAFKPRVAKLAELNKRYGVTAIYHTHSGVGLVGASIWDLHIILQDFDPEAVAINYDIGHATTEGGFGGWINSFYIAKPHIRGLCIKDCVWTKQGDGKWKSGFVPLGTGMVHFSEFFRMVKESGFSGPLQLHFEYPLGGAEDGLKKLTIPQGEVFSAMKRDLGQLRAYLKDAGLSTT